MAVYKLYSNQRIGVFVDVQNFYYSAKQLYNAKVNFAHILKDAIKGRQLVRALAYVIKADVGAEKTFFDALDLMGYEVRSKDIQIFVGGAKKGDWDVGITMDCIALAQKLDVVIICSGDGDFLPLVDYLQKSAGCRVEVMAFGRTTNKQLKEAADAFFDLCNNRYLIDYSGPRMRDGNSSVSDRKSAPHKRTEGSSRSDRSSMPRYRNLESGHERRERQPFRRPHHAGRAQPPRLGKDVSSEALPKTESSEPAKKKSTTRKPAAKKKTTKKKTAKKATTKKTTRKKTTKKGEE